MMNKELITLYRSLDLLVDIHRHNYLSEVFRNSETSYAYIYKRLEFLKSKGLIKSRRDGRRNFHYLTNKGEAIMSSVLELNTLFISSE